MKIFKIISAIILSCIFSTTFIILPAFAETNNKFGIHISQKEDLEKASELINSNGGDWGYVTIVIQENDRNQKKWQDFFDLCREKHLIPIIRIAAEPSGDTWKKPEIKNVEAWGNFLDSFNWPVKIRYITVYNEPNHTKEWGGEVNPKEYAQILSRFIEVLKNLDKNFFIMNAGLDQAASNSLTTMDEYKFLSLMDKEVPGIFNRLDGWVSHSYPNHGFVGKPWEKGKASIKGYDWELAVLKTNFGLKKELKVFITETGWPHSLGLMVKNRYGRMVPLVEKFYKPEMVALYLEQAFLNTWLPDNKVIAVTPFIINYPAEPFLNFSWLDSNGNPYPQFDRVKQISKEPGQPEQITKYEIVGISYPSLIPANNYFKGRVSIKNTGQSIWGEKPFAIESLGSQIKLTSLTLPDKTVVKPGDKYTFEFEFQTPGKGGEYDLTWNNLPVYQTTVFEAWKLTNTKDTFFNRTVRKLDDFWYNLSRKVKKILGGDKILRP